MVIMVIRAVSRERLLQTENLGKNPIEPHARRSAAKQMIALGKQPPAFARIGCSAALADPQGLHRHTLRIEHAEDIMVRVQQELGGVTEILVVRKPDRIGMAVRTDDREPGHFCVKPARDSTLSGIARQ